MTGTVTREMHERLSKQLAVLNAREDRLIDLAADGSLSKAKIQQRINTLRLERKRVEEALADTGEELAIGDACSSASISFQTRPSCTPYLRTGPGDRSTKPSTNTSTLTKSRPSTSTPPSFDHRSTKSGRRMTASSPRTWPQTTEQQRALRTFSGRCFE